MGSRTAGQKAVCLVSDKTLVLAAVPVLSAEVNIGKKSSLIQQGDNNETDNRFKGLGPCGFSCIDNNFMAAHANRSQAQEQIECATVAPADLSPEEQLLRKPLSLLTTTIVRHVNIAVHVVRYNDGSGGISAGNITTAIQQLKTAFSGVTVIFTVTSTDYIDNTIHTNIDSLYKVYRLWNAGYWLPNVLNVYFVPSAYFNGIAEFPGRNLIVVNSVATNGSTLAHEVGHNLYLRHTHSDAVNPPSNCTPVTPLELVNGSNCTAAGDYICDTPAEPFNCGSGISGYVYTNTCGYFGTFRDANNELYTPNTRNFMGYAPANCRNLFSAEQINVTQNYLSTAFDLLSTSVAISNEVNGSVHSGSTLTINNQLITSPGNITLIDGNTYPGKTNHERLSGNNKHRDWNAVASEYTLSKDFTVNRTTDDGRTRRARFTSLSPVTITTQLIEGGTGGNIEFRDPWYLADASGNQPNQLLPYGAPFSPTGAYNQSTGGVFTLQDYNIPGNPYYSVGAPSQQIGNFTWNFVNWKVTQGAASFQNANAAQTGVVFNSPNTTVTATLKGHRISNSTLALSANQQRKFSRWREINNENGYKFIYESGGQIWEVFSTDMGGTWRPEKLVSTNPGTHKNPSLAIAGLYQSVPSSHDIVWHTNASSVDQIWYRISTSPPRIIGNITAHPSISPAPVIARRDYEIYQLLAAYTRSNGIDVMKSSDYGTTWIRDTYSDSLNGRYRPSLSSAGGNTVYLAYDNGRRVYFDFYYRHCLGIPCGYIEGWWRVLYRGQEEVVPGSVSNREGFIGNAQVVSPRTFSYDVGVVWEMQEGLYVADALKEEQMEVDVHDERGIRIQGTTEYSVCFQSRLYHSYPWDPVKKFVGNNYRSPTISYVTDNKLLWMWTNGQNIISTQSTDRGLTWSTPTMLHTGIDPHAVLAAGEPTQAAQYVYRSLSGPIYQVGPPSGTVQNVELTDGVTREIIVADESSDASLSIELSSLWLKTSANTIKTIPFAVQDDSAFSASVDNVEQYLGVAPYTIPQDADSVYLRIRMGSKRTSILAQRNVPLRVKVYFTIDGSPRRTAAQWRFTGDNSLNKTFRLPARQLRGKQVQFGISILGLDRNNPDFRASVATVYRCASGISPENKIAVHSQEEVPHTFDLEQNYPNPFNPATVIRYQLPENGYVSLKIYDVLGREVAALVDEYKEAGYYEEEWDASGLSSGVYIYRLRAGSYTAIKKMLLAR